MKAGTTPVIYLREFLMADLAAAFIRDERRNLVRFHLHLP
jgi:hypothetical protein